MNLDWRAVALHISRRMWFRSALYALLAAVVALTGVFSGTLVPSGLPHISASALRQILGVLASSMLVVTTFSVSTVVTAYASATSNATPRASSLLVEDGNVQRSLAGFIGAFLFAMVGLVGLSAGIYDVGGRFILLVATALVILAIVVVLLRWIDNVSRIGQVSQTIARAERATRRAMTLMAASPVLQGQPWRDPPDEAVSVRANGVGYVTYIDVEKLQSLAVRHDLKVWATVIAGDLVTPGTELARISRELDDKAASALAAAFVVEHNRSFQQDPRFGLIVLTEMAQRALSPAVNDPGTAIDVLSALTRLLHEWAQTRQRGERTDVRHDRLYIPELRESDFFDDAYAPLARDSAAMIEVILNLQRSLATLGQLAYPPFSEHAGRHASRALEHGNDKLSLEADRHLLEQAASWCQDAR